MPWVDYKAIKATVSITDVIARYGCKVSRSNATHWRGKCPLPTHPVNSKHDDSFSVGFKDGSWKWACHSTPCVQARNGRKGGNVLDLVGYMESCNALDSALKLASWYGLQRFISDKAPTENGNSHQPEPTPRTQPEPEPEPVKEPESTGVEENKPLSFTLKVAYCDFLKNRGLTEETCNAFGVGVASKGMHAGRVVVPIHSPDGQHTWAYIGRSVDGSEPKFKIPPGFHASLALYNFHRATGKTVVLVEGVFDVLWLSQNGIQNACALIGTSLSEAQADLIASKFKGAHILMDGDAPGREAADKIAAKLCRRLWVKVVDLPEGKDPDEMPADELRKLLV